jgi:hypothetical protein
MAMVHVAIYDAVDLIDKSYALYPVPGLKAVAPPGTSPEVAAAVAADKVLDGVFPKQAATFDAQLQAFLASVPNGASKTQGITLGQEVAQAVLTWRSTDGSNNVVPYVPGTKPGDWRPTPPAFAPALFPQWPQMTPFAMTSGSQFRPGGPPELDSNAFAKAFNEVKDYGRIDSTVRTADQTQIADFWADGAGTATPPGHWNEIAEQVAQARGDTLVQNARLFALLNIAEADAGIVSWDAKYAFNFWRPITAIREADTAGNPKITADPTWTPLLVTPPFPSYTSGHSTFSAAAASILSSFFGKHVHFTTGSDFLPGVSRSFKSFTEAAEEAGQSRIYGGIHYQFDNQDGLRSGRELGDFVFDHFLQPVKKHHEEEDREGPRNRAATRDDDATRPGRTLSAFTDFARTAVSLIARSAELGLDPGSSPARPLSVEAPFGTSPMTAKRTLELSPAGKEEKSRTEQGTVPASGTSKDHMVFGDHLADQVFDVSTA